jgi:hypothetical protein
MYEIEHKFDQRREAAMAATAKPPVRFTRRGRLVIVLALLVAAFVIFSLGRWGGEASASDASASDAASDSSSYAPVAPTTRSVIVEAGQTLWDIARAARPDDDPRDTIHQLEQLNPALAGGVIVPGQEVLVPT